MGTRTGRYINISICIIIVRYCRYIQISFYIHLITLLSKLAMQSNYQLKCVIHENRAKLIKQPERHWLMQMAQCRYIYWPINIEKLQFVHQIALTSLFLHCDMSHLVYTIILVIIHMIYHQIFQTPKYCYQYRPQNSSIG